MAKFTKFETDSNWVDGVEGDYRFQAKLYDVGSPFGINGGRVSKLWIGSSTHGYIDNTICNYDRGWDVEPDWSHVKAFNNIMNLLENSPKRFGVGED